MAIPENKQGGDDAVSFRWGTWEELLLAFAVNRHGTTAWSSIATELQKRNLSLTPQHCRLKYLDLKRRYVAPNDHESNDDDTVPLLEELRKLRVAELRREVQRYDLNIEYSFTIQHTASYVFLMLEIWTYKVVEMKSERFLFLFFSFHLLFRSLELKMKSMEEERDRGSKREKTNSDLERKSEDNTENKHLELDEKPSPAPVTGGELFIVEESEKDHMSVNESNSTDLGAEKLRIDEKASEPVETEAVETGRDRTGETREEPDDLKSEPDRKPVREESCNGSSNSIEKELGKEVIVEPASDSGDLVESEAESKGGGGGDEAMKESSDVQSSASRSRKEEGIDKAHRDSTSGDERDHEDQSRAVKETSVQSQPFVDFLQALRAHKLGSVFERRLRSQESSKYQKLILQHVDLQIIETRLKEGWYSGSASKFFRDLLLLANNALVFFSKNSSEAQAAIEIRQLILKEMSQNFAKSDSSSGKQISLQSLPLPNKGDHEPSHSLLLKPRISGSLIVCRKRSSIAAKSSTPSSGADKKKQQITLPSEEKDSKPQPSQPSSNAEEPKITKKRTRDRFSSASANSKKIGKNQANNSGNKNPVAESGKHQGKGGGSLQHSEPKGEKKKNQPTVDSKKRGAANFLNRMKQSSSSNNGLLLDALKNTPLTSESTSSKGGSEPKKNDNAKRGEKKDHHATRRSAETRQVKEKGSPPKRNVGRPPKRGAVPPPALGKRGRERGETEIAASKQPKKRSRKL